MRTADLSEAAIRGFFRLRDHPALPLHAEIHKALGRRDLVRPTHPRDGRPTLTQQGRDVIAYLEARGAARLRRYKRGGRPR